MLPAPCLPQDIYRRIELDARVEGADGIGLTRICLERTLLELARAAAGHRSANTHVVRDALIRAASSVAGLARGIAPDNPMRGPLLHLYGAAEIAIRASLSHYRADTLARIAGDLRDIENLIG